MVNSTVVSNTIVLYSSLRIAPKFWSNFDPVGISILGFLVRFGPFRAIPRPDSDSGRSDLHFQHVRPQKIMKYVIFMKFQKMEKQIVKLKKWMFFQKYRLRNLSRIQDLDLSFRPFFLVSSIS